MGAEVAPPLTLVTLDRTPFNIITKSVGEAVRRVYPPAVLRLGGPVGCSMTGRAAAMRPRFTRRSATASSSMVRSE